MKPNKVRTLFIGLFVALIILVGLGTTAAQAQARIIYRPRPVVVYRPFWGPRWGWGHYWDRTITVVDPIAQQRESGYSDGRSRGKDDAKKELGYTPQTHKHYYNSNSLTYREAFLKGYADGYNGQMHKRG